MQRGEIVAIAPILGRVHALAGPDQRINIKAGTRTNRGAHVVRVFRVEQDYRRCFHGVILNLTAKDAKGAMRLREKVTGNRVQKKDASKPKKLKPPANRRLLS